MMHPNLPAVVVPPPLDGELIAPGEAMLRVVASPHPFSSEHIERQYQAGMSIAEVVALIQPEPVLRRRGHVWIGDEKIPQSLWHRVRPKPGTRLTIRMVPQGGGSSKVLRFVLLLAVAAAAIAIPGLIPGIGGLLLAAGTGRVGALLINAGPPR
jgi:hypothetical protein